MIWVFAFKTFLQKAWTWLKKYWVWIVFPVGLLLLLSKRKTIVNVLDSQLSQHDRFKDEIDEEAARQLEELERKKKIEIEELDRKYLELWDKLTVEQREKADSLKQNPDKLNEFLLEVGKSVREGR